MQFTLVYLCLRTGWSFVQMMGWVCGVKEREVLFGKAFSITVIFKL